ncbi:MAG: hypothetical protein GQ552_01920 [Flavobacteriaceae bacterium]|nr:hypothetical protein [Flavobacteriaceae bacterium]
MILFKRKLTFIFLLIVNIIFSQKISGIVLDGVTNKPLEGASVFFNNTAIGTTTNYNGEFSIAYNKKLKAHLIISFIGYQTQSSSLGNYSVEEKFKIYLYESRSVLNEIVLSTDDDWSNNDENDWPRELKLKEFKKHYIGESKNSKSCSIINEKDIILSYNSKKKKLIAITKGPIYIKNESLKYLISIELQHFEVNYSRVSKNKKHLNADYVFYSGNSFFKSLENTPTISTINLRKETYFGSTLHFMRSLSSEELIKEGFQIYFEGLQVVPKKYIKIAPIDNLNSVSVRLKGRLDIIYDFEKQSSIKSLVKDFYIDSFGNHFPIEKVKFGGDLGEQRMGDALPLDYLLNPQT